MKPIIPMFCKKGASFFFESFHQTLPGDEQGKAAKKEASKWDGKRQCLLFNVTPLP